MGREEGYGIVEWTCVCDTLAVGKERKEGKGREGDKATMIFSFLSFLFHDMGGWF